MGEEEKQELQPQKEEAAAPEQEVVIEKISDDEFASLLGETFGDFKKLSDLLPSFKTSDGDLVRGVEWLDPKKSFQRKEFLTKPDFASQRKLLAQRLETWVKYLAKDDNPDAVRQKLTDEATKLETNLDKNMKKVHRAARDLETTYRAIDKFFANAQQEPDEKVNAWFANVSAEDLVNPDDKEKFEQLAKAIADEYREEIDQTDAVLSGKSLPEGNGDALEVAASELIGGWIHHDGQPDSVLSAELLNFHHVPLAQRQPLPTPLVQRRPLVRPEEAVLFRLRPPQVFVQILNPETGFCGPFGRKDVADCFLARRTPPGIPKIIEERVPLQKHMQLAHAGRKDAFTPRLPVLVDDFVMRIGDIEKDVELIKLETLLFNQVTDFEVIELGAVAQRGSI